jgi:uncharacterized membrane protein
MWLAMIAFWALLIWVVYSLVAAAIRWPGPPDHGGQRQPADAHRILDERLARGEISTEEYQRLCEVLDSGTGHSTAGSGSGR